MSTPAYRLTRLLNEGARFTVTLPGQNGIDVTPDVIATLSGIGIDETGLDAAKESIRPDDSRRDVPTGVHFP